jgi:hypothetical protein
MERKDRSFQWKTPIRFYGKVIDEDGNPVKGAKIRMGWNGMLGSQERFLTSDAQGLFSITGIRGKLITAKPSHPDYHFSLIDNQWAFDYAAFYEPHYHVPDAKNPVVFTLVKKNPRQPLWHMEKNLALGLEGTRWIDPVWITRQNSNNELAGLEITWKRSPANSDKVFDWQWQVEGKNGLLVQPANDQFPTQAPSSGYISTWKSSRKGYPLAEGDPQQTFYYKFGSLYGLLRLEMSPVIYNDKDYVRVEIRLNPLGQPYLEFDSSMKLHHSPNRDNPTEFFCGSQKVEGIMPSFFDFFNFKPASPKPIGGP